MYVAFTCQQCLEKILKAIYVKRKGKTPPYTHNIRRLLKEVGAESEIDAASQSFFESLDGYYIESRYTEYIVNLSRTLNEDKCRKILSKTEGLYRCLKNLM